MDPVAHTLFGAALAESGLKRRSRYATATLLIGANLPDIDAIAGYWGDDFELYARRGWTHGILALVVLPLLLAGAILLWNRWRMRSRPAADAPAFHARAILALSFLAVWSHPLLDWMNTYGVRLLMPFDGRWFYGDTLFIVDPWFWLLTAVGVVLARSEDRRALMGWMVLGAAATALIVSTALVPLGVKLIWCLGVAGLVFLRMVRPAWAPAAPVARVGLLALTLYIGSAYGLARLAEATMAQRYPAAQQVQANPLPGTPFTHRVVAVEPDRYVLVSADGAVHAVRRQPPNVIVQAAMASDSVRGFINWMRFPYWKVEARGDHWLVSFWDLRYQGPDTPNPRGIGFVQVEVPRDAIPTDAVMNPAP